MCLQIFENIKTELMFGAKSLLGNELRIKRSSLLAAPSTTR